jgi:hypothetical protein
LGLVAVMAASYVVVFLVPFLRDFFELDPFWDPAWIYAVTAVAVAGPLIVAIPRIVPTRATA